MQLDKLQSNILKSHNRKYMVLLPLQFRAPHNEIVLRSWMAGLAQRYVTSASQQLAETARFRQTRQDSGMVLGNFFISADGYKALGLHPDRIETELLDDITVSFAQGMKDCGEAFNDPPKDSWDEAYRGRIDAMILLSANDASRLLAKVGAVILELRGELAGAGNEVGDGVEPVAKLLSYEMGKVLLNDSGQRIEHFGFVDGISDPQFPEAGPKGGTRQQWDPRADAAQLVLAEDRFAPEHEQDCWGSFLVYRKLEQNVKRFKDQVRLLAKKLANEDEKLAGAMMVGRFPNGSPLVLSHRDEHPGANDFDYRDDPEGNRCPFASHIRKLTPRGSSDTPSLSPLDGERTHRIVRRGITYGERAPRLDDEPETGVGTHFLCFQRSIPRQFAFLQKKWANQASFPPQAGVAGLDPIAGQAVTGSPPPPVAPQQWPIGWDQPDRVELDFGSAVTLKGGEFFFAPSLPFLLAGSASQP